MPLLTDTIVRNLKAPAHGEAGQIVQRDVWDEAIRGFGLRVSSTGKKSWIVGVRILKEGRRVFSRIVLGTYPAMSLAQARENAREAKLLASQNKDPRELNEREKAARIKESRDTFGALVEEFLAKYVERKGLRSSTKRDYQHTLKGRDVVQWKQRPVASITKRDVRDAMDRIVARGAPVAANHFLAYVRRFFRWCVDEEYIEDAPTDRVSRPVEVKARERALSPAEITEVWDAIGALEVSDEPKQRGDVFGRIFKLLLLTGQRREEVAAMRWDELKNLKRPDAQWDLPGERTKNKLSHIVPLSRQAAAILRKTPRIGKSPFVFTTSGRSHVSGFSKAKIRLDDQIAKARKKRGVRQPIPEFVVHDLRRTVSTRMHEDLRIQPHIVEAVLNHVSGHRAGVAGTYNRALYLDEKRAALQAWADWVEALKSS
jgi:integrase